MREIPKKILFLVIYLAEDPIQQNTEVCALKPEGVQTEIFQYQFSTDTV